jgi:hypothetical protein
MPRVVRHLADILGKPATAEQAIEAVMAAIVLEAIESGSEGNDRHAKAIALGHARVAPRLGEYLPRSPADVKVTRAWFEPAEPFVRDVMNDVNESLTLRDALAQALNEYPDSTTFGW